jgi:hypothetical protein
VSVAVKDSDVLEIIARNHGVERIGKGLSVVQQIAFKLGLNPRNSQACAEIGQAIARFEVCDPPLVECNRHGDGRLKRAQPSAAGLARVGSSAPIPQPAAVRPSVKAVHKTDTARSGPEFTRSGRRRISLDTGGRGFDSGMFNNPVAGL